jgi:serine/threonine protein kinase
MLTLAELSDALGDTFDVLREIHQGGQRAVYEVAVSGDRRVLKLMPEAGRARAEREVGIARSFDHPNLPRVLDETVHELTIGGSDYVYFTETLVEGETLAARSEPMNPCEALELGRQLASAVKYLWERHHVVHRDIKPLNIMVTPEGKYILLDLGVARHQDRSTLTVVAGEHQPGTIGYLAPEQLAPLKGREIDYRADFFCIGIVVFEQLTGHLPFDPAAPSYRTLLMTGNLSGLDEYPPPVAGLLGRLLAPRAHARFRLDRIDDAIRTAMGELECF